MTTSPVTGFINFIIPSAPTHANSYYISGNRTIAVFWTGSAFRTILSKRGVLRFWKSWKPGLFHKRIKFLRRIGVVGRLYGAVFFAPVIEGTERNVELLAEYIQSGTLFISADDFLFEGRCVFFWHDRIPLNIWRYHPETCRVWMKKPPSTKRDGGSGLFS